MKIVKRINWKFILIISICSSGVVSFAQVRSAVKAGGFYSANREELQQSLNAFYNNAQPATAKGEIQAIWVPHAGHRFSGQIAANAYYSVRGNSYDAVIIVAPSHSELLKSISVGDYEAYSSPLGQVPVHKELVAKVLNHVEDAAFVESAHQLEHAIEVQIPFIQSTLPGVPIVPILVGRLDTKTIKKIAQSIHVAAHGYRVLLVASSDMSHYPSYDDALKVDGQILKAVEEFNLEKIDHLNKSLLREGIPGLSCALCGWSALQIVMRVAEKYKAKEAELLPYANSGDISGNRDRVVGYGAAVFYKKPSKSKKGKDLMDRIDFTREETEKLFSIARASITAALRKQKLDEPDVTEDNLRLKRGVFVTLTNNGQLRGCIGNFSPSHPLWEMTARMSAAAATQDYRFTMNPVTEGELENIDIKISVLSEMKKIKSIKEIEIGKHGIWIRQGSRNGTYLPEVAVEMGWNTVEFLEHCCQEKAGLDPDAWKKKADIYIYSSQIISEE